MKKAFTLMELVFVIIIIGILSAVVIPRIESDKLREAAVQLVSHIRYTQHLAMVDDKFDVADNAWYKHRWQLKFSKGTETKGKWSYVIFSDLSGAGNPDPAEVAINPLDRNKRLTGGSTGASMIHTGDDDATDEMNLGLKYGILGVAFSASCRTGSTSKLIAFDSLGRPLRGNDRDYTSSYTSSSAANILIVPDCTITICSVEDCSIAQSDEKVVIAVEAETGYAHIL